MLRQRKAAVERDEQEIRLANLFKERNPMQPSRRERRRQLREKLSGKKEILTDWEVMGIAIAMVVIGFFAALFVIRLLSPSPQAIEADRLFQE